MFPWWVWVLLWCFFLSPFVGIFLGQVIRNRNRQSPEENTSTDWEALQRVRESQAQSQLSGSKVLYVPPSDEEGPLSGQESEAR